MAQAAGRFVRIALVGSLAYYISTIARDDANGADTKGTRPHAAAGADLGRRIVAEAKTQRGVPYSWGGGGTRGKSRGICCSPGGYDGRETVGFDCSGLVQYAVYQASRGRIILPRVAADQVRRGKPVSRSAMRPGDLIGFDHGQGITHIGIYVGDGRMVQAPQTGDVVKISPLAPRNDQRWTIRRLQ
ncbi:C40 family peptidase [Actinomadura rubrisoli]|uniref:C40 family peptidase n=1 Tax=Actinomadura rubrisoli TaxID=2530368 RepID=UPI001404CC2E|nr:C40 family peptidase [Actinomadura rubrisoli]